MKLLILVKVNSSEFLLPLESLLVTITLHNKGVSEQITLLQRHTRKITV